MPRFTCPSCDAGFYSAAGLVGLNDKVCSDCGSLVELAVTPSALLILDDRLATPLAGAR
jgi:hypothetical protein